MRITTVPPFMYAQISREGGICLYSRATSGSRGEDEAMAYIWLRVWLILQMKRIQHLALKLGNYLEKPEG